MGRRLLFGAILLGLGLVSVELASRVYMAAATGAPLLHPDRVIYAFYPTLRRVVRAEIRRDDEAFDILVLAASVLHPHFGTFNHAFRDELALMTRREVRIHNLSMAGHTSADSVHKYRALAGREFDLVIVYHGINDLRTNNIPAADYRDDYSHMEWYRRINWVERYRGRLRWVSLPYTLHDLQMTIERLLGRYRPIPLKPLRDHMRYGAELKTVASFRHNLGEIATMARERGDPLVLMTFAWHLPQGYSKEKFERREAGYALHWVPVEAWGMPEHVAAGLDAHNAAIRELAAQHPEARLIDQEALVPRARSYWNDVCHLSTRGMQAFVENILSHLQRWDLPPHS